MKERITIVFYLLFVAGQAVFAQQTDPILEKAEYIFEGKVLKSELYYAGGNDPYEHLYTSSIVEVEHVLKGNIQPGTVEIIVKGGIDRLNYFPSGTPVMLQKFKNKPVSKDNSIFFCVATEYPDSPISSTVSNRVKLTVIEMIGFSRESNNPHFTGLDRNWKTKKAVYEFLSSQENIKLPAKVVEPEPDFLDPYHNPEHRKIIEERKKAPFVQETKPLSEEEKIRKRKERAEKVAAYMKERQEYLDSCCLIGVDSLGRKGYNYEKKDQEKIRSIQEKHQDIFHKK